MMGMIWNDGLLWEGVVAECATSYPRTGAVHNLRHSGESRNPEGTGNGEAHVI